jgi:hypothetical protein
MTPTRRFVYFAIACHVLTAACGEDDDCDCSDDDECSTHVTAEDHASGDFEILDDDGDTILRLEGFPTVRFERESFAFDLVNASITIPAPSAIGSFPVEAVVCDERNERSPRCAHIEGTIDVTELVPNCGSDACGRLAFSLHLAAAPADSPVSTRGTAFFERRQRTESHCIPSHGGGCNPGCGRGFQVSS